jgi:hypothetical protein
MTEACSRRSEIEHWVRQGASVRCSEEDLAHAAHCDDCGTLVSEVLDLRSLFSETPASTLPDERVAILRFRLAAEAKRLQRERAEKAGRKALRIHLIWSAAMVTTLAAAIICVFSLRKGRGSAVVQTSVAEVQLLNAAIGHNLQPGPNEVYELVQGQAEFNVRRLVGDQRFRVLVGDDQVEVRGTKFRVVAGQRHLESVQVFEGRVQVSASGRSLMLDAGQDWVAEATVTKVAASASAPTENRVADAGLFQGHTPPTMAASSSNPSATKSRNDLYDVAFSAALAKLRAGDSTGAVTDFDILLSSANVDAGRKGDVLYWSAVAYHRSAKDAVAEQRLRQMLAFQSGWHTPDAALLLGEILLARGMGEQARPWLTRAAQSGRPNTSTKANTLLAKLKR